MDRVLQRESLEEGIDQRRYISDKFPLKNILLTYHKSSNQNTGNAAIMIIFEVIRQFHSDAHNEYKKHDKLLKSHEGSQRHDSDTIRGEDVD